MSMENNFLSSVFANSTLTNVNSADDFLQFHYVNSVTNDVKQNERPYKCDECGRSFGSRIYLRDHLTIHSDVRAYECNVCSKRFRFGSNLSEHRTVHMSDNLFFKCSECEHAVRLRGNLKKHMRTHFGSGLELEQAWQKLCREGYLSAPRISREDGSVPRRGRHSLNARYALMDNYNAAAYACNPPPLLNQTFAYGDVSQFDSQAPKSINLSNMMDGILQANNGNARMAGDLPPPLVNPLFIPLVKKEMKSNILMSHKTTVEDMVANFTRKVEDCASMADSADAFFGVFETIVVDAIDCSFCWKRFASHAECKEHIDTQHEKPADLNGNLLFCETCLRWFANSEAFSSHMDHHNLVKEFLDTSVVGADSRLQRFKTAQQEKFGDFFDGEVNCDVM